MRWGGEGGLGHKRIACAGIKIKAVGSRTNEQEMGSVGEGDAQVKREGERVGKCNPATNTIKKRTTFSSTNNKQTRTIKKQ